MNLEQRAAAEATEEKKTDEAPVEEAASQNPEAPAEEAPVAPPVEPAPEEKPAE